MEQIKVVWLGQAQQFPYRIYATTTKNKLEALTSFEELSLMTRHQDGYIREIAIVKLMRLFPLESIPYLVQLLGEYVLEIHFAIIAQITPQQRFWVNNFFTENAMFEKTIRSRIASYWNCYYRFNYLKLNDYPAFRLLSE
ncbi:hypothetical protein [Sphingobacterium sp.]|uniref:hypothetical protein n=1 Tax=Sphingobacterium sp. TaxID=341027 RepID=UPI0031D8C2AC